MPGSQATSGGERQLVLVVRELADGGMAALMVSHAPDHAFAVADTAAVLAPDGTLAVGQPTAVLTEDRLTRIYGNPVRVLGAENRWTGPPARSKVTDHRTRGTGMGRRWVVAALAVVALAAAGCSTGGLAGGGDPRDVLLAGAEPLAGGGSARARVTFSLPGSQGPDVASEGVVSWRGAGGSTGELTLPSIMGGGQQSRALFTEDAMYVDAGSLGSLSGSVPGLTGKEWIKQSYADVERDFGPLGKVLTAAIDQTNPVRSAALLVQSPDLRQVGAEQVNGVATTHYAGTIRFTDAVEDLRLGLDRQVLDELRREFAAQGLTDAQQYDLWVDDQGRPVRAQGRVTDAVGPESYSVDYSDYGPPRTVQTPPADQVVDKGQLMAGLGGFPN